MVVLRNGDKGGARLITSPRIGLYDLDILEIGAGLRPATLDRLPMIGKEQGREVYHLNGLYRHGILLSPLMGKAMADLVQNRKLSTDFAAFGIR